MAITEWYVKPGAGNDDLNAGRGESYGDPWASVRYALATGIPATGVDTTNGDRVNVIVNGDTADVLTGQWNLQAFGASGSAPLVIEGCTSVAGDGGIGLIDGNGYRIINDSIVNVVTLRNLSMIGWGTQNQAIVLGDWNLFDNITLDFNNANFAGISADQYNYWTGCTFKNIKWANWSFGICSVLGNGMVDSCYFSGTAGSIAVTAGMVECRGSWDTITNNIFKQTGTEGLGIHVAMHFSRISNNTFYSVGAGTEAAIYLKWHQHIIRNNYIEGWGGVGGSGIETGTGSHHCRLDNNYFFGNTANVTDGDFIIHQNGTVQTNASGLTDPDNDDFSPTVELQRLAYPDGWSSISQNNHRDVGAVQHADPSQTCYLTLKT